MKKVLSILLAVVSALVILATPVSLQNVQAANTVADNGCYIIKCSTNSKYCLDITGESKKNRANVRLYQRNGNYGQKFVFRAVGNYYYIQNMASGLYLTVTGGKAVKGANIMQYELKKTKAQKWQAVRNSDGTYTFVSAINSSYCLDLTSAKVANGTNIRLWTRGKSSGQKWRLVKLYKVTIKDRYPSASSNSKVCKYYAIKKKYTGKTCYVSAGEAVWLEKGNYAIYGYAKSKNGVSNPSSMTIDGNKVYRVGSNTAAEVTGKGTIYDWLYTS